MLGIGGFEGGVTRRHTARTNTRTREGSGGLDEGGDGLWQWSLNTDRIPHIPDILRGSHRRRAMGGRERKSGVEGEDYYQGVMVLVGGNVEREKEQKRERK